MATRKPKPATTPDPLAADPGPTGPDEPTRVLIWMRSGGTCERCLQEEAVDIQHRDARGMGGSRHVPWINMPSNLAGLGRRCHDYIERVARERGYRDGWAVRQGVADQLEGVARIPVTDLRGRVWLLDDVGGKRIWTMADYDPLISDLMRLGES